MMMRFTRLALAITALSSVCCVAFGQEVEVLGDNFAKQIESGRWVVKFYAPWCGHCKNLAPTWEDLAKTSNENVHVGKLDCTVHNPICAKYDVSGYPTILAFHNGDYISKYAGDRSLTSLQEFSVKDPGNLHVSQRGKAGASNGGFSNFFADAARSPFGMLAYVVGLIVLVKFAYTVCFNLFHVMFRRGPDLKKAGSWGLVTGATDGIGKAYAFELARRGLNVILVSRTQEKLDAVKAEIAEKFPKKVEVETLSIDFTNFNKEAEAAVRAAVADRELGLVINNVGMSYQHAEFFTLADEGHLRRLLEVNVNSTVWMTKIALEYMANRKKGYILNVSSAAGRFPDPLYSLYSASKSFIDLFSQSLNTEYAIKGVYVQAQTPYFVATKMSRIRKATLMVPSPATFARCSLNDLGSAPLTVPYWPHALQHWAIGFIPSGFFQQIRMRQSFSIRERALKKKKLAEEAKKTE